MKLQIRRTVWVGQLVSVALLGVVTLAANGQTPPPAAPPARMPHTQTKDGMVGSGSGDMKQSMVTGMDSMQKMQMSGDWDKDFAMMMKLHHEQGVEMAQMELTHGKSPAMKSMAKKIIFAQQKEIAEFDQWLAKQK